MKKLALSLLMMAFAAGCSCAPKQVPIDAGPEDSGFDAGPEDSGFDAGPSVDAGFDAGVVDAGEPPVLKVKKILPSRGGSAGGTPVILQGSGFLRNHSPSGTQAKKVTTLKVGGNSVIDYQIIDDETLELRTPPGKAGPAHVAITNPLGTFTCNNCFNYYDELVLSSATPSSGPLRGGTEVTLKGEGFTTDLEVLFGTISTPKLTFVSSTEVKVVVPRGLAAELVDVVAYNKNGVGTLRRNFLYVGDLRLTSITPPTGAIAGGTAVLINGSGFTDTTTVKFGANAATDITLISETQLSVKTPAGAAGAVDVTFNNGFEPFVAKSAFAYVDPAGSFAVFAVYPHVAKAGDTVTLLGQALDTAGLTVTVGGQTAVVDVATFSTAKFVVPPRAAAPRKSDVAVSAGPQNATLTNGFTWKIALSSIAPARGPAVGGTQVTVSGSAMPADAQLFIGALAATVTPLTSETTASAVTPRGSGGAANDLRMVEAADPENETVLPAVFTFDQALSLGRVQPERGAIAGGTLVTVLGAGFGDATLVNFATNRAKDVKVIDSHTLTCRTPRGDVGVVDVSVERDSQHDDLPGGFAYFDPRSISGGLSGAPLTGTVNVTVLDATQGFYGSPVPLAQVIIGSDPATPYQGFTDTRGQVTFSDPPLVKSLTVTVYKDGYESATVTNVNAENLTVFITRTAAGDGNPSSGPPPPPASVISGRVTGFKAPRVLSANESLEARVFVASTSLFSGPPFGGVGNHTGEKWQVITEGGQYLVYTGAGLRATYAILGIANSASKSFTPVSMGIRRGITTTSDNPAVNQDIVIDQHLDLAAPITIDSPLTFSTGGLLPMDVPGVNSVYAWLDLGPEGFVPNPNNWGTGTVAQSSVTSTSPMMSFPNFPQLDGTNFIFLNESASTAFYPVSYYFRRQPGNLANGITIGPMLVPPNLYEPKTSFTGAIRWTQGSGAAPDIHQVQIIKPTLLGTVTLWTVVLPGTETQVVLPAPAVTKLKTEEAGNTLYVIIYSSRSPKFAYNQWTYDSLSAVTWSSFTLAVSAGFQP